MKTKLTDTLDYSKTLDFNHHGLVDNIAIFSAHTLFCCCDCVISIRERFLESRCVRLRLRIFSFTCLTQRHLQLTFSGTPIGVSAIFCPLRAQKTRYYLTRRSPVEPQFQGYQ